MPDSVSYVNIDVLEFKDHEYVDIFSDDEDKDLVDTDDEDSEDEKRIKAALYQLKHNNVIINFTGIKAINEVIIKTILPGSMCKIVMF